MLQWLCVCSGKGESVQCVCVAGTGTGNKEVSLAGAGTGGGGGSTHPTSAPTSPISAANGTTTSTSLARNPLRGSKCNFHISHNLYTLYMLITLHQIYNVIFQMVNQMVIVHVFMLCVVAPFVCKSSETLLYNKYNSDLRFLFLWQFNSWYIHTLSMN